MTRMSAAAPAGPQGSLRSKATQWVRREVSDAVAQQRGPQAAWRITDRRGRMLAAIAIPIAAAELAALIFQVIALATGAMRPGPGFAHAAGTPAWVWVALIAFQGLFTAAVTTGIAAAIVMGAARHRGEDPTIRATYRLVARRWRLMLGAVGTMWALEVLMAGMWMFAYRTKPGISPWWLLVGVVVVVAVPLTAAGHTVWPQALLTGATFRDIRSALSRRGLRATYTAGVGVLLASPVGFFPMWLAVAWFVGGLSVHTIPSGYQPLGDIAVTALIVLAVGFVARYLMLTAVPHLPADTPVSQPPTPQPTHPGTATMGVTRPGPALTPEPAQLKASSVPDLPTPTHPEAALPAQPATLMAVGVRWWLVVSCGVAIPAVILRLALWWAALYR